nr:Wadjet anti-phage system protein JetD domain-containing protein [Nitrosomonas nitrosa]
MPQSEQSPAERLLHILLDRFEAPAPRVRDITQTIDYTQVGDPAAQDEFHRILQDAERAGAIALEKERLGRFTGEYARVRLSNADALYGFLVRPPAGTIADTARRTLAARLPHILKDTFFRAIEDEAVQAWASNKTFLGLSVQQLETFVTILRLTHGIVHLAGRDIDHRTFSRRIVKDSKALEGCEGRVAQLLKRRNPELAGEEPREILEASGIVRRAHLLQVKGPVQLVSGALRIDGTGDNFIGLPWPAVQTATLAHPVEYVITIENATSFWRYCTEINGNYLALLTDGFPARDVLSSMGHLVKVARGTGDVPIFHWGDIDAGGVRIAAHLQDAFGVALKLHEMQPDLARALGGPLLSRTGLAKLSSQSGDIGSLARWLCGKDAKALEQEELDPKAPERRVF